MLRTCVVPVLFLSIFAAGAAGQDAVVIHQKAGKNKPATPIPTGYKTYSLFLLPSADWEGKTDELRTLRAAFNAFGHAIGDQHAAVWFTNEDDTKLDIIGSKAYCDKLNLNYNNGPYIVATNKYPPSLRANDAVVVIKLGGIDMSRATTVLNILEQDLRQGRPPSVHTLIYTELTQRLLTITDRHGSDLKDIVTTLLKIK
jgi:hypothetical protein